MHRFGAAVGCALGLLLLAAGYLYGADPAPKDAPLAVPIGAAQPASLPGLHNVFRLSERLYSGSAPEGEEGFRSLRRLGIRTILSVDGMPPDVARARRYGMRYVHLPFGYDGCPRPTANRIVRAVRDLPGPVYIHCHHGKRRGPAAAAFVRIALEGIDPEQAARELARAGAEPEYEGLYRDVRTYRPPAREELDALPGDFPEVSPTPPLMASMVAIDSRMARLLALQKQRVPPRERMAREALQLRELFTELNRNPAERSRPPDYRARMAAAERDARALEEALRRKDERGVRQALGRLAAGCDGCHTRWRNRPGATAAP